MAGLGDMFGASLATVNGGKPRNSDRIQTGQPLNLRGAFEAATNIPVVGDALSGGMAMYDAAKGDYPSATMNALGVLPFVSGTFIGKGAKTWDAIKAADAEKRIAAGDDVRKVWKETGTFKGPDGNLRQEIDDSKALIKKQPTEFGGDLSKHVSHSKVFKAYPEAKDINYSFDPSISGGGSFEAGSWLDKVKVNPTVADKFGGEKSITMHELQHFIQNREGWQAGGSVENMTANAIQRKFDELMNAGLTRKEAVEQVNKSAIGDVGYGEYRRLAGEAEARATQSRMPMNMEQRLNTYPLDSYDVPVDQLIIRGNTPLGAAFGGK